MAGALAEPVAGNNDLTALAEMIEALSAGRDVDAQSIEALAAALARREPDLRGALTLICNHMARTGLKTN